MGGKSEWASAPKDMTPINEPTSKSGEWIKLKWDQKQKVNKITLFDKVYHLEQVCNGILFFSDGSFITVDKDLPATASKGLEISFETKEIDWVVFVIQKHGAKTRNPGLSEFAVFRAE